MGDSSFLDRMHARFSVPRPLVVDLVQRATASDVIDLQRVVRGFENETYRVEIADATAVYVRIRRPGNMRSFHDEAWAMERARDAGVPVPHVVSVDVYDTDDGERPVMVAAAAPGRQLVDVLGSLSPQQRRAAMRNLGEVLAVLHSVRTKGPRQPVNGGTDLSPAERRRRAVTEPTAARKHLSAAGLTSPEVERTIASLHRRVARPGTPTVLCHGDLSPDHVFVDEDLRICSLIDWGLWGIGSTCDDLADIAIRYRWSDLTDVLDSHGAGSSSEPAFYRAVSRSILHQAIGHITHHVQTGDRDGLPRKLDLLRAALTAL